MRKTILFTTLFALSVFAAACGSAGSSGPAAPTGKTIATGPAGNNLTAILSNLDGALKKGVQEFTLTFTDSSGKPVDVGSVALNYRMAAMGSMSEMNTGATFTTTGTPGVYKGKADIEMGGEWKAMITYEGAAGKNAFSIPVIAK
ncbi:MAG: FixH family protein [Acidobacteriota bacterium]